MTEDGDLLVETVRPQVVQITLNRPHRLNALTFQMLDRLYGIFERLGHDSDCRVVIITGAGRGFCSGHDLKETDDRPPWLSRDLGPVQENSLHHKFWASLIPRMRAMPQPIIAAVNGPAAGGGFPLALGADIRIASHSARFHDAFIKVGLSGCEMGLSYLLPRMVGMTRAAELMLTGRQIDGIEAERIGLVSRVVPDESLLETAYDIAELILANSPFGVWMTKETMWANLENTSLAAAIELEARTQMLALQTADRLEQRTAFLEKRAPIFNNI